MILTDKRVFVVCHSKTMKTVLSLQIAFIKGVEVHSTRIKDVYLIVFYGKKNERNYIATDNMFMCNQVYHILNGIIEVRNQKALSEDVGKIGNEKGVIKSNSNDKK